MSAAYPIRQTEIRRYAKIYARGRYDVVVLQNGTTIVYDTATERDSVYRSEDLASEAMELAELLAGLR